MVDKVFYINLAHRHDRRQHICAQLEQVFSKDKLERIDAVQHENGAIGCSMSHITALEEGIRQGHERIAIFEDDFTFYNTRRTLRDLAIWDRCSVEWDVLLLAGNEMRTQQFNVVADRVLSSQTASGYIVRRHYAPTLLKNFREGLKLFVRHGTPSIHAVDQYWKRLQPTGKWFFYRAGRQMPSYSDIERRFMDYGC